MLNPIYVTVQTQKPHNFQGEAHISAKMFQTAVFVYYYTMFLQAEEGPERFGLGTKMSNLVAPAHPPSPAILEPQFGNQWLKETAIAISCRDDDTAGSKMKIVSIWKEGKREQDNYGLSD